MRVSDAFELSRSQPHLDFVDVDTSGDVPVFIDPRALLLLPRAMRGTHGSVPQVEFLKTKAVRIEAPEPTEVWADGEPLGQTPLTLEIVPGALEVVVPPEE